MKNNIDYLFAYGSLRSGFKSDAYNYISRYFTLIGPAVTQGYLYDMGNYPVAKPTTEEAFIKGELFQITHPESFDYVMAQLDDYEGIHSEADEQPCYVRTKANIMVEEKAYEAWVYWYTSSVAGKPIVASGDVMEYIKSKS